MKYWVGLGAAAVIIFSMPTLAQDLGVHGTVYDIEEEDVVAYIKRRLVDLDKSGEIKRRQEAARETVRDRVLHPKPIPGISTATENRVFYFDPTFIQKESAVDAKGRIIVPAGTMINPLQYGGLSHKYVFIDARDKRQVDFALNDFRQNMEDKIVLTGGSWADLSRKTGHQIYFDQGGYLTRRFGITKVPAVVSQDGLRLKIEEKVL